MKKFDSINVIPFIDIMLVLLAIVLTTATFVSNGQLDIDLPASSSSASADSTERVEVAVDKSGVLYVDGEIVTLEAAETQLRLLAKDTPIVLVIDEVTEFGHFVEVVDILKKLSLDKVSVLTRNES